MGGIQRRALLMPKKNNCDHYAQSYIGLNTLLFFLEFAEHVRTSCIVLFLGLVFSVPYVGGLKRRTIAVWERLKNDFDHSKHFKQTYSVF